MINLSQEPKINRRGVTVAKCEPVCCVSILTSSLSAVTASGEVRRASSGEIPHHLESLLCQSTEGLSVAEKKVVSQLLCEFSDLFSTGTKDLGCTSLAKHQIQTGDVKPIWQPPQRLPLLRRKEAEEAMQEMEQQGVIEPSTSAWSSPVVLVTKKMAVHNSVWTIASSTTLMKRTLNHCRSSVTLFMPQLEPRGSPH